MVSDLVMDAEECEKVKDKIEADAENRYLYVERQMLWEAYKDMEDFIETVKDENLQEKLYIAIDGRDAFRRFKNVLHNYFEERKRWFAFRDTRLEERILEWLEAAGYEPGKRHVEG